MADFTPTQLCDVLEKRYVSYLTTSFPFRDPVLRESFENSLRRGSLTKGPYLQSTPSYRPGASLANLLQELGYEAQNGLLEALHGTRSLYLHQEKAIRKVNSGRNIVVSTGTGSGKTESFLLPIIMHLYKQHLSNQLGQGVRALILYPMNALANDQRDRLAGKPLDKRDPGGILYRLEKFNCPFSFTFGQYIGETPEDEKDKTRNAAEALANRFPGELVLRNEIRTTPPNLLLTNFSMLEYLLLRPDDSPLFDDGNASNWTFLVLDEAHQYRGAKATEMAMLIRRLKQRLRAGGQKGEFRCIATSASLANGEHDKTNVARFASHLFDEPFEEDDIILGETEPVHFSGRQALSASNYVDMLSFLQGRKEPDDTTLRLGMSTEDAVPKEVQVANALLLDQRAETLFSAISTNPLDFTTAADKVFPDMSSAERTEALQTLLQLMISARLPDKNVPLLRLRYHFFIRALEGAFLNHANGPSITTERSESSGYKDFELAICKDCGQHYLTGRIEDGYLKEAMRAGPVDERDVSYFMILNEQEPIAPEEGSTSSTRYILCLHCGQMALIGDKLSCGHSETTSVEKQAASDTTTDQLKSCAVCNSQTNDPVREIIYGGDGPQAVITTALFQSLPHESKKILAFADSRHEAAYFAWFLERSYQDIFARHLMLKVMKEQYGSGIESFSIKELALALRNVLKEAKVLSEAAGDIEILQQGYIWIFEELLGIGQRNSLEGSGLISWKVKLPADLVIPETLCQPPFSLKESDARRLVEYLLKTLVEDAALEVRADKNVSISFADMGLGYVWQPKVCFGPPKGRSGYLSWNGPQGKRFKFILRLIDKSVPAKEAGELVDKVLAEIWQEIQEYDGGQNDDSRILLSVDDARRLNSAWLRASLIHNFEGLYQCEKCSRTCSLNLQNLCPRPRCKGRLVLPQSDKLANNHYVKTYNVSFDELLRVEEHTAQLATEIARSYQRRFKEGKIHVLSCSTTFELGVDLGDLDAVFLRNVPPEAFNYDQRVGRSGRRIGKPGVAITYCKRGPHDLYHFREPERMISGKVSAPVVNIQNVKIVSRHLAAIALSSFFRQQPERFKNVQSFLTNMDIPQGVSDFRNYLLENKSRIEDDLSKTIPSNKGLMDKLGLIDGTWIEKLCGPESRLDLAEREVVSDYQSVRQFEHKAIDARDYRGADWAKKRSETIADEQLLGFLSRKAVIPKYGFPVDVVELDTQTHNKGHDASSVTLSRDLGVAISEFAPGMQLIANKLLWTSYGLKIVKDRNWKKLKYRRCDKHNVFQQWDAAGEPPEPPCPHRMDEGVYVIPVFGFVTAKEPPKAPSGKIERLYSSRPYFNAAIGPDRGRMSYQANGISLLELERSRPGSLTIICEGPKGSGFMICTICGAAIKTTKGKKAAEHKTPLGMKCVGQAERFALGQELATDVLRMDFKILNRTTEDMVNFAHSLSSALVEAAADVLEIPPSDLSSVVGSYEINGVPPIILYDNVPGGAGMVGRLEKSEVLLAVLRAALDRVSGSCGCADHSSCYACLRSYRNQHVHQRLHRGPVFNYLKELVPLLTESGNPSFKAGNDSIADEEIDWDLFSPRWQPLLRKVESELPATIGYAADVCGENGVVGEFAASICKGARSLYLLDAKNGTSASAAQLLLEKQGKQALVLDPQEDIAMLFSTIRAALEQPLAQTAVQAGKRPT